jgi:hypothetical protein
VLTAEGAKNVPQTDRNTDESGNDDGEQQATIDVKFKSTATRSPPAIKHNNNHKINPLNLLREIYFDGDSKVTMLLPDDGGTGKASEEGGVGEPCEVCLRKRHATTMDES